LRSILSRYLNIAATDLVFSYGPQGKPVLPQHNISFNLSHSGELALLAIARRGDIGVDIEVIDPARATGDIAARYFSPAEQEQLQAFSGDERIRAFFHCWSRKESVIKALGEGLLCPLHSFDVNLAEHEARLLAFRREDIDVVNWNMASINADEQYAAAVTIVGACDNVAGFNW
jgi:4'-phosphopantetheinyl transferase